MFENATYIIVRHYIDGASSLYFSMVCCIILIIIVVIVVCIFLGFVIYIIVITKKSQRSSDQPLGRITKNRGNQARNLMEDSLSFNAVGTPASSVQEFDAGAGPNVQSIPLSTFRRHNANGMADHSSESSADLYDVLFPGKPAGEVDFKPPKKLVTFAGQVYASGEGSSQTNLISAPSTSRLAYDNASGSLEWDYYPQDNLATSAHSDDEQERRTQYSTSRYSTWV